MQAKAPGQLKAAKAAADSLLSPEDLQKQRNKQKNKNLCDHQKLMKQIAGGCLSTLLLAPAAAKQH